MKRGRPLIPRPLIIEADHARVPLTRGYEAIIDLRDVEFVGQFNWYAHIKENGSVYAARTIKVGEKFKQVVLHRDLMAATPELEVDHRDGDTLNYRRRNLRLATRAQNVRNRRPTKRKHDLPKGVSPQSNSSRFCAAITADGKVHRLGTFDTPEQAHAAYIEAAQRLHGEFARTS